MPSFTLSSSLFPLGFELPFQRKSVGCTEDGPDKGKEGPNAHWWTITNYIERSDGAVLVRLVWCLGTQFHIRV